MIIDRDFSGCVENSMVLGDYYDESPCRIEREYDPAIDGVWEDCGPVQSSYIPPEPDVWQTAFCRALDRNCTFYEAVAAANKAKEAAWRAERGFGA